MPYIFTGFDDLITQLGPGSSAEGYFEQIYAHAGIRALGGSVATRNLQWSSQ